MRRNTTLLLLLILQTLQVEAWFGKKQETKTNITPKNQEPRRRPPPQFYNDGRPRRGGPPPQTSARRRDEDDYYSNGRRSSSSTLPYPPPPPPPSRDGHNSTVGISPGVHKNEVDPAVQENEAPSTKVVEEEENVNELEQSSQSLQAQAQQSNLTHSNNMDILPPPPPPPPFDPSHQATSSYEYWEQSTVAAASGGVDGSNNFNYYYPPPPPPPPGYYPEQQQYNLDYAMDDSSHQQAQAQIRMEDIQRENDDLEQDLANATEELALHRALALERLEMVDALTEKLADAEAFAASESNAALEAQMNATELAIHGGRLKKELDCIEEECRELKEESRRAKDEREEMKDALQEKVELLEELASSIEMARLKDAQKVLDDRGFFARLLGSLFSGGGGASDLERIKAAQELSRNTLMGALKAERSHVEELEQHLSKLRQNNTAISEMVSSRDDLITELNDRVQVFEEDKMVLKAALKQLQKEMREDAPKTAQIQFELDSARTEIEVLNEEIAQMRDAHDEEVAQLSGEIGNKKSELKNAEARMATIASYVDQLEERLATFKVAKREVQEKEKQFKEREETEKRQKAEEKEIKAQLEADVKRLQGRIDGLIEEASSMREEKEELLKQIILLQDEMENLTESLIEAENEKERMIKEMLEKASVQEEIIEEVEIATLKQPAGLEEYDEEYDVEGVALDDYDGESSSAEEPQLPNPMRNAPPQQPALQRSPRTNMLNGSGISRIQKEDDTRVPSIRTVRKAFAKATGIHGFFSSRPTGRQRTTTQLDFSSNGNGQTPSQ